METNQLNPIHVIYADDDEDDRELFQLSISEAKLNCQLYLFEDGCSLLKHIENLNASELDIIFLDINMPLINGRECLREIKNNKFFRNIPVIILSTSSHEAELMLQMGANLFIPKLNFFKQNFLSRLFFPGWKSVLSSCRQIITDPSQIPAKHIH